MSASPAPMSPEWTDLILGARTPGEAWKGILDALLRLAAPEDPALLKDAPDRLHRDLAVPDRLLAEAAWNLWETAPESAESAADALIRWTTAESGPEGRAVLILDALSLAGLPILLAGARKRGIGITECRVALAPIPTDTDHFARALGAPSRASLKGDGKPSAFRPFAGRCRTDVPDTPFEDCPVPPDPGILLWHAWPDSLIHQDGMDWRKFSAGLRGELSGDAFWDFADRLRTGRKLLIAADHGHARSDGFQPMGGASAEAARKLFGASRCVPATKGALPVAVPPLGITRRGWHAVLGRRSWRASGGFPKLCHGGISLMEAAIPLVELPALRTGSQPRR